MDKNLKHNYPFYEVEPFSDFKEMIAKRVLAHPDKVAFRFTENKQDKQVTYKEHHDNINALGTAIIRAGFTNSKIAMVGENCYEWILSQITVLGSDNAFVPVDKELPEKDLINVINHSDSELVFCTGSYAELLAANKDKLLNVKLFVCFRPKELPEGFADAAEFMEEGRKALAGGDDCYTALTPDEDL
ncbi:MAG: AMP-binding protein, partial [Clostridia bacterium]|nr:AMP-binding protein [Clostridia bacterium]